MVGQGPANPARLAHRLKFLDRIADIFGLGLAGQKVKAIAHVHFIAALGILGNQTIGFGTSAQLTHGGNIGVSVKQGPQFTHHFQVFRAGFVIKVMLKAIGIDRRNINHALGIGRRIVAQQGVMHIIIDRVMAEAIHTALQPEFYGFIKRGAHILIVKIQVGLRHQKIMQIILAAPCIPLPCTAAENRQPVVGRRAIGLGIGPDIPIRLCIGFIRAAFLKPRMAFGGVGEHLINHHLQAQPVRLGHHGVKIRQSAEHRVHGAIIFDIIAEIFHRRFEERAEPDRINAQTGNIIELFGNAGQIADPIAIGVHKTARINLINHRPTPPVLRQTGQNLRTHKTLLQQATRADNARSNRRPFYIMRRIATELKRFDKIICSDHKFTQNCRKFEISLNRDIKLACLPL